MIIANLYDRRTNLHKEILEKFEAQFGSVMAPEYTVDSQQIRTVTEEGRTLFDVPDDELLKTGADAKPRSCSERRRTVRPTWGC